jgi:ribosomal protein S18 acetylase RimI-like enzyme
VLNIRTLGFRTDVLVRLTEGSQVDDHGDHLVVRTPRNPGFWWGNFVLVPELRPGTGPNWLARFAAEFPGADHVAIGVDVTDISELDPAELTERGLTLERSAALTSTALKPPLHRNTEAVFRPLSSDDDWRQAAVLHGAVNAGGPGADLEFITARIRARRAATETGHGTWYGAFLDRSLAADLGVFSDQATGLARYQDVGTHPSARRQGLAGTLVWHAGQATLSAHPDQTLVIVADPDDVAFRIYQSVGFTVAQDQFSFQRQPG